MYNSAYITVEFSVYFVITCFIMLNCKYNCDNMLECCRVIKTCFHNCAENCVEMFQSKKSLQFILRFETNCTFVIICFPLSGFCFVLFI